LVILADGDLIWEIAKSTKWTLFNPKTGKNLVLTALEVNDIAVAGWIQHKNNSQGHRLDYWEISSLGRDILQVS
jgi:hypothetical protein